MEIRPIPCLNTKLPPGVKVLIVAPVKVSNKIILLEPENIKIVGGEIDEMAIENAYENVLLKLLKKPITGSPITNYVENQPEAPSQATVRPTPTAPINIIQPRKMREEEMDQELQKLSIDDDDIDFDELDRIEQAFKATENIQPVAVTENPVIQEPVIEVISDDEEKVLRELEEQFYKGDSRNQENNPRNEEIEIFEVEMDQQPTETKALPKNLPQSTSNKQTASKPLTNPWTLPKRPPVASTTSSAKKQTTLNFQSNITILASKPQEQPKDTPPKKQSRMSQFLIPADTSYMAVDEFDDFAPIGEKRKSNEIDQSDRPLKTARFSPPSK
jgi:hypothetical protein